MALPLSYVIWLLVLVAGMLQYPTEGTQKKLYPFHHRKGHAQEQHEMKLKLFFHHIANVTTFQVVGGVAGNHAKKAAPFGTTYVGNDPVTEGPNLATSPKVGSLVGAATSVSTSPTSLAFFGSFTLNLNNMSASNMHMSSRGNGSLEGSLAFMGTYTFVRHGKAWVPVDMPVVGGTGSFLFAQGSVAFVPVDVSTFNQTLLLEAHLIWPSSCKNHQNSSRDMPF